MFLKKFIPVQLYVRLLSISGLPLSSGAVPLSAL
jgi:hypothetical protein